MKSDVLTIRKKIGLMLTLTNVIKKHKFLGILSVSSLKIILPAELEDPVSVGAVRLLFVRVSEPANVANDPSVNAVLN